jgi:protein tyrosine phosphatase (PTP) superfamily phosphohydrolase (DUF442 family)
MKWPFKELYPAEFSGYAFLAFCWLFNGFAMGTVILLWPVRIWVNYVRDNNLPGYLEPAGVVVFIVVLVIASFRLSLQIFQWQLLTSSRLWRVASLGIPAVAAAIALWLFLHPDIINKGENNTSVSEKFTLGPYPDEAKIAELKKAGYTDIISLLHPAVVPFEPRLIKEEEGAAAKANIHLIRAPMLPWIGDNEASLKTIADIVKNGKGKYYIHCYLGKDRVNVVKNLIVRLSGSINGATEESQRTFEGAGAFERGELYRIDTGVYVTPYPTDEEFLSFFLAGHVKTVINIMDSTANDAKPWVTKEMLALKQNAIVFKQVAIHINTTEEAFNKLVDSIRVWPKPLVIHHWNTACPESVLLRKAYYNLTKSQQVNLATKNPVIY